MNGMTRQFIGTAGSLYGIRYPGNAAMGSIPGCGHIRRSNSRSRAKTPGPTNLHQKPKRLQPIRRAVTDAPMPITVSAGVKYRTCCGKDVSAVISLRVLTAKIKGNAAMAVRRKYRGNIPARYSICDWPPAAWWRSSRRWIHRWKYPSPDRMP